MSIDITAFTTPFAALPGALVGVHEDVVRVPADYRDLIEVPDPDDPRLSRFTFDDGQRFGWREYLLRDCRLVIGAEISGLILLPDGRFLLEQFPNRVPASINHLVNKLYREALAEGRLPEREPLGDVLVPFVNEWFNHYHLAIITLPLLRRFRDLRGASAEAVLPDIRIDLPGRADAADYVDTLQRAFGLDPRLTRTLEPGIYPLDAARFLVPELGPIDLVNAESYRAILDGAGGGRPGGATRDLFFARGNARNPRPGDADEERVFQGLRERHPRLEKVVADRLTMGQQIARVRAARSVGALHGAALTNMIFAERGTLEVSERGALDPSGAAFRPHFHHLAVSRGFRYRLLPD